MEVDIGARRLLEWGMTKVMLVDDEMLMMDGMAAMLSDLEDISIVAKVSNGHQALAAAMECRPDIIIQDVLMKTGTGSQLARAYRKNIPGVRVLGCSTVTAPEVIQEILHSGARGYITKNEAEGVLESAIRQLARGDHIYLSPRTTQALANPDASIASLTPREREVLAWLCHDVIPKQVADFMKLSTKTVYNHLENIRRKAGVNNMIQLYILALQVGVAELPG